MDTLLKQIRLYLIQSDARADEDFQRHAAHLSYVGLRILSGGLSLFLGFIILAHVVFDAETGGLLPFRAVLGGMGVGIVTFVVSFLPWDHRHSVLIGSISVLLMTMSIVWSAFLSVAGDPYAPATTNSEVLLMLLIAVITLALHPLHTLWLGAALAVNVTFAEMMAVSTGLIAPEQRTSATGYAALTVCVLFATGISAVTYRRIYGNHLGHRHELEAAESARAAQSQLLLSESAASMGRLAATVSHEINTPLGALMSSSQLLLDFPEKKRQATPEKRQKIEAIEPGLVKGIYTSAGRLKEVVERMQRITNLDRAEILEVHLNELIQDVLHLFGVGKPPGLSVAFSPSELPAMTARPQQLSAVFSNLMHSAAGRLGQSGSITIASRRRDACAEVTIHDDGTPLAPEIARALFEPGFQVTDTRIAGSDWGLFSSREMIRRHGGDITVESTEAAGTTVTVTLPLV